ncbi:BRO family protein [Desulfovibrio piger]|nr:BRO family protein [Desulfovibrio piger]
MNASAITNASRIFQKDDLGSVRVIMKDNEPWFVGRDVCIILGTDPKDIPAILDRDERMPLSAILGIIDSVSDYNRLRKDTLLISEAGVYSLILRSRKPAAKAFKRWVTHEVLPAIHRHGIYATESTVERMLADPDAMIAALTELKRERELRKEAEAGLSLALPKAETYDAVVAPCELTLAAFCRRLENTNLNLVRTCLMQAGVLYMDRSGNPRVYARYRDTHFSEKFDSRHGSVTIMVLPKGQQLLTRYHADGVLARRATSSKPVDWHEQED